MTRKTVRHLRHPATLPSLIWKNIKYPFTAEAAEARYDARLGIDTRGILDPQQLDIAQERHSIATRYEGTPPRIAEHLIGKVIKAARGFTFVDFGSGKGRVLAIAAKFEFQRIIGIEFSARLNEVARRNIAATHCTRSTSIEILHLDAAEYEIPNDPCVLFFFNPFKPPLIDQVAARIRRSYLENPRKIFVIFYNLKFYEGVFARFFDPVCFIRHDVTDLPLDRSDRYGDLAAAIFESNAPT